MKIVAILLLVLEQCLASLKVMQLIQVLEDQKFHNPWLIGSFEANFNTKLLKMLFKSSQTANMNNPNGTMIANNVGIARNIAIIGTELWPTTFDNVSDIDGLTLIQVS